MHVRMHTWKCSSANKILFLPPSFPLPLSPSLCAWRTSASVCLCHVHYNKLHTNTHTHTHRRWRKARGTS